MSESEDHKTSCHQVGNGNGRRESYIGKSKSFRETRCFPPAMPRLGQTGSSPGHMPWFLKRSYTDNGRLVLQEVKVQHRQFFQACRVNGRLTLRLMHSSDHCNSRINPDDLIEEEEPEQEEEEEEEEEEQIMRDVDKRTRVVGLSLLSSPPSTSLLPLLLHERRERKLGRWLTLENMSRRIKNKEMSRAASSPSLLSLTRPESPSRVCFPVRRTGSFFQIPLPTIRPVHS